MLYERNVPFRPDFEVVASAVIDFVQGRDDLDGERIAMVGRSWGGYLGPRAAAGEPRIRALSTDPAQFDMFDVVNARMPAHVMALYQADDPAFDDAIWKASPGVAGQEFCCPGHAHTASRRRSST